MFKLLASAAAAVLLAGPAIAAPMVAPTGRDLAACRTSADQPICLLKLVARGPGHRPFADNIEIAYSPQVLAAVGEAPDAGWGNPMTAILHARDNAAVQALVADRAGAPPQQALAPVRAIVAERAADPAQQAQQEQLAALNRIAAYRQLWTYSQGEAALPSAHRPSPALVRAALDGWRAELGRAGGEGDPEDLADAYRSLGDLEAAEAIAPLSPMRRIEALIRAGRYAEAADVVAATEYGAEPMDALVGSTWRAKLMQDAISAGQADVAVRVAERSVARWLSQPDGTSTATVMVELSQDLLLVAELAPREEAVALVERVDAAGRRRASAKAPAAAVAAIRAWLKLGERRRATALAHAWSTDIWAMRSACAGGDAACAAHPSGAVSMGLRAYPLDASWNQISPLVVAMGPDRAAAVQGGRDVQADLAAITEPEQRMSYLRRCAGAATDGGDLSRAADCARRLASEPAPPAPARVGPGPSYEQRRLATAIYVAWGAAKAHDETTMRRMLDLTFDLAARQPDETIEELPLLETVAIAQLRAQGRL